jgi:GNAT superfamily N-acetyltransferase
MKASGSSAVPQSVCQTAWDAIRSKQAAWKSGYLTSNENVWVALYGKLLCDLDSTPQQNPPLVHAGYGVRVLCMLYSIQTWIDTVTRIDPNRCIRIISLGAGLDVLGLWSLLLGHVHVIEVDTPMICSEKRSLLVDRLQWIEPVNDETIDEAVHLHGSPTAALCSYWPGPESLARYSLLAADLRQADAVEALIGRAVAHFDQEVNGESFPTPAPTLIVSEVVLAYLGGELSGGDSDKASPVDQLLSMIGRLLGGSPSVCPQLSCFLSLEPVGSTGAERSSSVLAGYQEQYFELFAAKLRRGQAASQAAASSPCFRPLAPTCCEWQTRIKCAANCQMVSAWTCAAMVPHWYRAFGVQIGGDLWDEHAALILHLKSYSVAVGFGDDVEPLLYRRLQLASSSAAHWSKSSLRQPRCGPLQPWSPVWWHSRRTTREFWVTTVEPRDEQQLRDLFITCYDGLAKQHDAVRKMVATAVRQDFGSKSLGAEERGHLAQSAVDERFRSWGGIFLVAIEYVRSEQRPSSAPGFSRVVRGAIGCRHVNADQCNERGKQFEILRFFVDPSVRRSGLGTILLQSLESHLLSDCGEFDLIAKARTFLSESISLYMSSGFQCRETSELGNLTLKTLGKALRRGPSPS